MQHRHLHDHTVARLLDHDAALPVEDPIRDDHAAPHRQAVHEAAIVGRILEPRLVDAPRDEIFAQPLVAEAVRVVPRRGPGLRVNDLCALHGFTSIAGLGHAAAGKLRGRAGTIHDRPGQLEARRPQHHHIHAAHRRHVHGGRRHRERQR
jgi:hypothetical protein